MASLLVVDKFIYTARHSNDNGHVKDYELSFSKDGKNWESTVKGTFSNLTSAQTITLETPVTARYFKFVPLSEMHGRKWASAAELNVSILKKHQRSIPETNSGLRRQRCRQQHEAGGRR